MSTNLERITDMAAAAGNPEWHVSDGHDALVYFHIIADAVDSPYGRNALNFDGDARTAYYVAAAVNSAPAMAASLISLSALAESIPDDAPDALREMAAAILDAAASVPDVRATPGQFTRVAEGHAA
ncbi:hypothetical protein [Arthrobacter caoxuetaonis]|uniref:Uncharacterized protein n=1 Tax=Arthrobacter caoxuetaonis TaxID=2886935 RepID=A0A9X1MHC1_9MICC|nr:hypothetical protein [Arthrobacter caoxuetaonis]MCC3299372.1 hypothetical protein [Arthrobacter caoxuetaonis]USQ59135.1 hypothetical protein NF551_18690 [Arthrobacter caoxuetaonis]